MHVVVVGGGILGTMHALRARLLGHRVTHLERDHEPRGASLRSLGLVWVSERAAGGALDLALRARERWAELGAVIPAVGFRANGSLRIARTADEMAALRAVAEQDDALDRGMRVLGASEARVVNPALAGDLLGAVHCTTDAAVEPRAAARAIRAHLAGDDYRWLPARAAIEVVDHGVRDDSGAVHRGDLAVVCTGAAHGGIAGIDLATAPLCTHRRVAVETEPLARILATTVATPAGLLVVQRLDGRLTIGGGAPHGDPSGFGVDEAATTALHAAASGALGQNLPPIERRWDVVTSETTDGTTYHRAAAADGVVVVTGSGARGLTLSPAIAEETFLP